MDAISNSVSPTGPAPARALVPGVGLAMVMVILVAIGVVALVSVRRAAGAAGRVDHTYDVLQVLGRIRVASIEAEAQRRAYTLTSDRAERDAMEAALGRLIAFAAEARERTRDNHDQQARLDRLDAAIAVHTSQMRLSARPLTV